MMEGDNVIGSLSQKQLVLIAGGGLALGLVWRLVSSRRTGGASAPVASVDEDYMNTPLPTIGGASGLVGRGEVWGDTVELPTVSGIVQGADGSLYRTDTQGNLVPVAGTDGGSTGGSSGDEPVPPDYAFVTDDDDGTSVWDPVARKYYRKAS